MTQTADEHHSRAAGHFDSAAQHHRAAEKAFSSGNVESAAYEAQLALGHTVQGNDHADLAAMAHLEHHAMIRMGRKRKVAKK